MASGSDSRLISVREARSSTGIVAVKNQAERAKELIRGLDPALQSVIEVDYVAFDPDTDGTSRFLLRGRTPIGAPETFTEWVRKTIDNLASQCDKEFPIDESSLPLVKVY